MAQRCVNKFEFPFGEDQFDKNHKFKIPDRFNKALNALHPEIEKLVICDVNPLGMLDPLTLSRIYRFELKVNVHLKDVKLVKGNRIYYEGVLNEVFKLTYVDMDFVTFRVGLIITPKLTNLQLFYKVFSDE